MEIFNDNEIYVKNKLINSLINNKLYKNDTILINMLNTGLEKLFSISNYKLFTSEIFINILIMHDIKYNKKPHDDKLLKTALQHMPNDEFLSLLSLLINNKYLNIEDLKKHDNNENIPNFLKHFNHNNFQNKNKLTKKILKEEYQNNKEDNKYIFHNCDLMKSLTNKINNYNLKDIKEPNIHQYGTFLNIDLDNNITLCLKKDLLLKECSIYFSDIYFNDKNFMKIKKCFKLNFENKNYIILNETDKFNYPVKIKNFSNNKYAYPHIFFNPYTSFYNNDKILKITHYYLYKKLLNIYSFPYLLPHYITVKVVIENINEKIYFKEECEAIIKTNIIFGNIYLNDKFLYFININFSDTKKIKEMYNEKMKYIFSSSLEFFTSKNKIIIINYNNIEEIIVRRYLYEYRAFEIFLKNGKSYYFNLFSKNALNCFLEIIEIINNNYNFLIIKEPKKYFEKYNFYEQWLKNKISTYQYLLYINKFSNRSYNDLCQYPIFPWVFLETDLGSYKNQNNLPKFRELFYPMSFQNEEDIEKANHVFYNGNEKYMFVNYISNINFFIRNFFKIPPFTEWHIFTLVNKLEDSERLPKCIEEMLSFSRFDNSELIPEFFTSIEFLLNLNFMFVRTGFWMKKPYLIINDVDYQEKKFFNSISQYIYYNRLILNLKYNKYDKDKLKINDWIDLVFGYKQSTEASDIDNINFYPKYCYGQKTNFEKKIKKYKEKGLDEKVIREKFKNKICYITISGQCPEVLFDKKHKNNILNQESKFDIIGNIFKSNLDKININNPEKKINKNVIISNFWLSENNEYIYFLLFEKGNKLYENINQYILIYKNFKNELKYILNLNDINLLSFKSILYQLNTNDNYESKINTLTYNINNQKNENNNIIEEDIYCGDYEILSKNCLFDICMNKKIYFFIGRNMDNSIKIYEIDTSNKKNKAKIYNIFTDSFTSCLYRKDKSIFFSGHKNGKLYEWKISYNNNLINSIEITRDLIAHNDNMIICINYIEKHNIIITSSIDGQLFIRKYYDFELLSVIHTTINNSFISKIIYTDYDLLYLLVNYCDKSYENKSSINVYTLNGLLIESSLINNIVDVEPLKNGKVICNNKNSDKLYFFGLNKELGHFNEYDILSSIKVKNRKIIDFIFQKEKNNFYILLDDKNLYRKEMPEFEFLSEGVDKLSNNNK